ncbi:Ribosomal protein arginine N-methyltransferase rmt3 [Elasticomyces elasticus]|nr:hypothetical protein LTR28_005526 [Elasticomyces elasticus]KAK4998783.1 Ribosomal protein arginine N-methyltransferase rmt3 [Elasticomyces elasticus]
MATTINGTLHHQDSASDTSSTSSAEPLDVNADDGWEDAEPDVENLEVKDFYSDETFPTAHAMLNNARKVHSLDFRGVQKSLGLDFYESIKLVNYIRSSAFSGVRLQTDNITSKKQFAEERYLQPSLPDDALLFCLDELEDEDTPLTNGSASGLGENDPRAKIVELEEQLQRLQTQFAEYRTTVQKALDERWDAAPATSTFANTAPNVTECNGGNDASRRAADDEAGYFDSYSFNEIHETMLRDTIRTNAYRDFIYSNKNLFVNKTVLDVGCGTGILSMFCAKAGATNVYAVDNSGIIDKARVVVHANGLQDKITCIRGKIEEVTLPLPPGGKVDIIVSEWMGYCLLYEAMLPSVLWARDRYLAPDGLMIPGYCTINMALVSDPDFVDERVGAWKDVYGFDMDAMTEGIYDEVVIRQQKPETLVSSESSADGKVEVLKILDLYTCVVNDLSFTAPLTLRLSKDIDSLDGFVTWFDCFFLPRDTPFTTALGRRLVTSLKPDKPTDGGVEVVLSTSPRTPQTHWFNGLLLIDRTKGKKQCAELKNGQVIKVEVGFAKGKQSPRALDVSVAWEVEGGEKGRQTWVLK